MQPEQPSGDEDLRRENRALKEQLEEYRHLDEDLASQRVFEKAKKHLIGWITLGGAALAVIGLFGLKQIYDLASATATDHASEQARTIAEQKVNSVLTDALMLGIVEAKIDERLKTVDADLAQINAEIRDARAQVQAEIEKFRGEVRGEVGSIRAVLSGGATPQKPAGYSPPDAQPEALVEAPGPPLAEDEVPAQDEASATEPPGGSPAAAESTSIRFVNRSRTPVEVYWVGYGGGEELYARLEPEQEYEQNTYVTHPWVLRTADDGRKVAVVVASAQPMVFEITPGLVEEAETQALAK